LLCFACAEKIAGQISMRKLKEKKRKKKLWERQKEGKENQPGIFHISVC